MNYNAIHAMDSILCDRIFYHINFEHNLYKKKKGKQ